jgi:long-chain fatty acid transport protein
VNNLQPGRPDGELELEMSGYGFGARFGSLVEFSPHTRLGLSYSLESKTDVDGRPHWKNLRPLLEQALINAGVYGGKIDLEMTVPQVLQGGFYHEVSDEVAVMGDLGWVDFSRFGKVDVSVGTASLTTDANYDDIWIDSIGLRYTPSELWSAGIGFTYVSSPVDDEDRTGG